MIKSSSASGTTPSWESLLDEMRNNEDLSPSEFEALEQAFQVLSQYLGDDFPAYSLIRPHPLHFSIVHNKAAFPKKWLIWFSRAIHLLSDLPGFDSLRKKLRREDGYSEASSVVRFTYRLVAAGWHIELYPHFNSSKQPDLRALTPMGYEIAVEVSALTESVRDELINAGLFEMTHGLAGLSTKFVTAGRLLIAPRKPQLVLIYEAAKSFAANLKASAGFKEYCDPKLVELAGEPKDNPTRLEVWTRERNIKQNQYSACFPDDDDSELMQRLLRKLDREATQVTGFSYPGLIAIKCSEFTYEAGVIHERSEVLVEKLAGYPQIIGVVIYGTEGGTPENILYPAPSHIYMEVQGGYFEAERWVFIQNPRSAGIHDREIRRELIEAFAGRSVPWDEWRLGWA